MSQHHWCVECDIGYGPDWDSDADYDLEPASIDEG
jgi:hypothetical protein